MESRENLLSIPVKGAVAVPGETLPRMCPKVGVYDQPYEGASLKHTYDMLRHGMQRSEREFLGWREGPDYTWYTYEQVHELAVTLGTALKSSGIKKGSIVGVFSANCPNWMISDIALSTQGMICAPLYDSLSPGAIQYVINHASMEAAFVQDKHVGDILEVLDACPSLKLIVAMGTTDVNSVREYPKHEKVVSLSEFITRGQFDTSKVDVSGPDDLAMIMYTSGTTGDPKGVMLSNKAFVAGVSVGLRFLGTYGGELSPSDTMLSFLPLAHIFEQTAEKSFMMSGGRVGYWKGDVKLILDDLMSLKPTVFFAVPRVYARFEQKIQQGLAQSGILKRTLFEWAYALQLSNIQNFNARNGLLDALLFSKVKEKLLPNVRFCVTGAAPMSKATQDFLKVVLVTPVCQGYGLTETCAVTSGTPPCKPGEIDIGASGTVGGPMNGYVKLVDVPDMEYLTTDMPYPRGEICAKCPNMFSGYYKNEEETRKVLTDDGWFHTGDIGQLLPDGSVQIIDRKKNLFKLSQGEYVSPEHIEGELTKCNLVGQLWVYGNSFERYLVGIVVPDPDQWKVWAEAHGKEFDLKKLSEDPELKKDVLAELSHKRKASGFRSFEEIMDIRFETELNELGQGFTVANDLLTPTFKMKRNKLQQRFQKDIDDMYALMR
uniref:AMP-dependent synthetase/ligase domain-containing protein n=1 Tax=Rhodosorus marinus TaxID=101924 RepID=A0A7S0BUG1_9RHOD|mmetsp:Transcript_990/g.1575  ORF Transcript_990/g.1575 Transcript_990/m.1575 type:complete len:659 (+) Transcript_990:170-2146(+)